MCDKMNADRARVENIQSYQSDEGVARQGMSQ